MKRVDAAESELYLQYPEATVQNAESPLIFILDPASPLARNYNHVYEGTNVQVPLVTFYRSDFLVSFERMKTMLPPDVHYNESIGYRQDWSYNMDIRVVSEWLADRRHNIRTVVINTGTHYNSGQFGGGVVLDVLLEVYRSAIEYVTTTLANHLRKDQITFFRASTSGHSDGKGICSATMPLNKTVRIKYFHYNWHGQETFNALWKTYLGEGHLRGQFENIKYLDISRPSMLRPDAVNLPIRYTFADPVASKTWWWRGLFAFLSYCECGAAVVLHSVERVDLKMECFC